MARLHANYANSGGSAIKCAMCNSSSSGLHKYLHVAVLPLTYRATFAYFNYKWRSSSSGGTSSRAFVIFITSQASHPSNPPTYPRRSCILSRSSMSRAMSLCLCKDLRCQATHSTRPYIHPLYIYIYPRHLSVLRLWWLLGPSILVQTSCSSCQGYPARGPFLKKSIRLSLLPHDNLV